MAKFTIIKDGRIIHTVTFDGERIELGSSATCALNIDDLEVALHQAAFVREDEGGRYRIEPLTTKPVTKLAGATITAPTPLDHSAIISVESFQVKIEYESADAPSPSASPPHPSPVPPPPSSPPPPPVPPVPPTPSSLPPLSPDPAPPPPAQVREGSTSTDPPLPPPLETETPPPSRTDPRPTPLPQDGGVEDKTVYVRTVGKLVAIQGPLKGQQWDLISGETRIGRDRSWSRITIRKDSKGQPDTSISRRHATIHVIGDKVFVEDQKSTAGTFVDGRQVPAGQKIEVADRCTIEIRSSQESTILRLELNRGSGAAAAPAPMAPISPVAPEPLADLSPPLPPPAPPFEPPDYVRDDAPFDPILSESSDGGGRRSGGSYQAPGREVKEDSGYTPIEDNPFARDDSGRGGGFWPKWMWVVIVVAVIIVAGLVFLAM